jgi:acyl-CoA synthetase (AMP-forming)/AMP-acid ligase II
MVAAILGILKTGNLYVPVDPSYPDGYTDVVLHACEPSAILTAGHLASRLRARAPNVPVVALTGGDIGGSDGSSSGSGSGSGSVSSSSGSGSGAPSLVPSWQGLDDGPLLAAELERPPNDDGEGSAGGAGKGGEAKGETEAEADRVGAIDDDCCYILFTSGSTGPPKGVVGRHSAAINRCAWMHAAYPFDEGEVMCHKTSLNFVDRYGGNRERDGGREGEGGDGGDGGDGEKGRRGVIYRDIKREGEEEWIGYGMLLLVFYTPHQQMRSSAYTHTPPTHSHAALTLFAALTPHPPTHTHIHTHTVSGRSSARSLPPRHTPSPSS